MIIKFTMQIKSIELPSIVEYHTAKIYNVSRFVHCNILFTKRWCCRTFTMLFIVVVTLLRISINSLKVELKIMMKNPFRLLTNSNFYHIGFESKNSTVLIKCNVTSFKNFFQLYRYALWNFNFNIEKLRQIISKTIMVFSFLQRRCHPLTRCIKKLLTSPAVM